MNRFTSRARGRIGFIALIGIVCPVALQAQERGIIEGRVIATDSRAPLAGVRVSIAGTTLIALTTHAGEYRITGVPVGSHTLLAERLGWRATRSSLQMTPGVQRYDFNLDLEVLPVSELVVTASREAQRRAETAATVHTLDAATIERAHASHPSELLSRLPGVWVNVTGGEGHMTAIRQPKTTNPVYLYAENGVPTRSTGFFNHNALYEIDVPHAERVEVVKGPATALYGSDAIGGTINVLTRSSLDSPPLQLNVEGGPFGFARLLAAASHQLDRGGVLVTVNATRTDGWRNGTAYDRQSGTVRWDHRASSATSLTSMITFSRIDQGTAGASAIAPDDYVQSPEVNYTPISYRKVQALRASAALERIGKNTLVSFTPFARWNRMEMLPNWSLTFDPAISETGHASVGALLKVRRDAGPMRLRTIAGFDLDYSPGIHREWRVTPVRNGKIFTDYTRGDVVYDYDVTFWSAAPYLQLEAAPLPRVRVTAGLRYDLLGYDYDNPLGELQTGSHRRPASTTLDYTHLSPKFGLVFNPSDAFSMFAAYGHGFRAPSEGQLFRQGRSLASLELAPVKADNLEIGAHAQLHERVRGDIAFYRMRKTDDLVSFTHADGSTETVNAGSTLHRGIELGLAVAVLPDLRLDLAFSEARHSYEEWLTRSGVDFSGREIEEGPHRTGSLGLTWTPRTWEGASAGVDAQHVGPFWMDPANTHRYEGHTIVSVRAEAPVTRRITLFGRLSNLLDERYAENAAFTTARGEEFAPGMPRAFYIGARYR